jgi:hypothetical protein
MSGAHVVPLTLKLPFLWSFDLAIPLVLQGPSRR